MTGSHNPIPAALGAFGLALIAGCTPPADGPGGAESASAAGRECFSARSVTGYRSAPRDPGAGERIYVDVGARDTYLFETFGACPELDFSWRIGLRDRGIGRICRGVDVDLVVPHPAFGTQVCPVRMIRKLGPGEEGARRSRSED
ncbi:DUF6491 family protein [Pelagerythrobacter marinus]|uniref:DUF6491 family protein n=1 Tax=Pelagerythrobacter marinus TaxID=538382 RepID=UPI002036D213|nr:DUF6491 family protein [Pelagerythrobacter marinus]USA39764.1 DUF6491 family protein [Pelagerythrobacter marinus]WPZ06105.1 DUF6491 family protein [Pelagerythrobacter marinus]